MSNTICIFCSKKGKKSVEHVWPKWLQNRAYGDTSWVHYGVHTSSLGQVLSERTHSGEALVLGSVCSSCNNGWMSDLESNFSKMLPVIENNPLALKNLSKEERKIVCLWFFKTAIVINASSNYRKIVPIKHYEFLYKKKKIPNGVVIDVTYLQDFKNLNWAQTQTMMLFSNLNYEKIKNMGIGIDNKYTISLQIGNLAVRVFWLKKEVSYKNNVNLSEQSFRLRPYLKKQKYNMHAQYDNLVHFTSAVSVEISK